MSDGGGWDVIGGCPRAGALKDGALAEAPAAMAASAGFTCRAALTSAAWQDCAAWEPAGNKGRPADRDRQGTDRRAGGGVKAGAGERPAARAVTAAGGPRAVLEAVAGLGPCAVLLVGAAGSGKSTLARQLAGAGDQALSIDALCQLASGDPYDHEATADAVSALRLLAEARLRRGLTVIVDAVNILAADRRPLVAMARRHGLPAAAVVMATPLGECLARNARRPAPAPGRRWGSRVPEETVRAQYRQVQQAIPLLAAEGFAQVVICGPAQFAPAVVTAETSRRNR